jgi:hypothetical protein
MEEIMSRESQKGIVLDEKVRREVEGERKRAEERMRGGMDGERRRQKTRGLIPTIDRKPDYLCVAKFKYIVDRRK